MFEPRDDRAEEFLSAEDLELARLNWDELMALWNFWLGQAQSTNEADQDEYSHGVFVSPRRAHEILSDGPTHSGGTTLQKKADVAEGQAALFPKRPSSVGHEPERGS